VFGKQRKEILKIRKKGRIILSGIALILTGLCLSFAVSSFSSAENKTGETVVYQSPLVWRTDGAGDYLLAEFSPDATYELADAVETAGQIESLAATWEFSGRVTLEVSADNGANYTEVINGVPVELPESGNQLKWKATLGPDSEVTQIKISYTDTAGVAGTFGEPELSGFKFRKKLVIDSPIKSANDNENSEDTQDLFNYQVKVVVGEEIASPLARNDNSSSLRGAAEGGDEAISVYCGEKIEADFQDVRFTAADGQTILPHYRESISGTAPQRQAVFWVKVPQIPSDGLPIYIYYGNPSAEDKSSGEAVFDFFADFSADQLNSEKWEIKTNLEGSYHVEDSLLSLDAAEIIAKNYQLREGIVEYRAKARAGYEARAIIRKDKDNSELTQLVHSSNYPGAEHAIAVGNIVKSNLANSISADSFYDFRIIALGRQITFQRYQNPESGNKSFSELDAEVSFTDEGGLTEGQIGLKTGGTGGGSSITDYDWLRVRKFAENPPDINSAGEEEEVNLAVFENTTLAENGNLIVSPKSEVQGPKSDAMYTTPLITANCSISEIMPIIKVQSPKSKVPALPAGRQSQDIELDVSTDGGAVWQSGFAGGQTYTAPYGLTRGKELLLRANLPVDTHNTPTGTSAQRNTQYEIKEIKLEYSVFPVVTSPNIFPAGASDEEGVFQLGDSLTVEWDNSASGDNNPDILSVTCNLEAFGGPQAAEMTDADGDEIYSISYQLPEGLDKTANLFVTAGNSCGSTAQDGHILEVDTTDKGLRIKDEGKRIKDEAEAPEEEKQEEEEEVSASLKRRYKIKFGSDEAEIGNFETKKFEPYLKLKRWGDETYFSIWFPEKYLNREGESVGVERSEIGYGSSGRVGAKFYKKAGIEDGGLEFEVVLDEVPADNVISLPFKSQGLNFYYQPPLTEAEKEEGIVRPAEIEGSYAVYHANKKGGQYRSGKAFHIYRPKIIDANGDWVWAELEIAAPSLRGAAESGDEAISKGQGILTITIDREWLSQAAYPVIVDPEFGYQTVGASSVHIGDIARGSRFTASAEMAPDRIGAYLENSGAASAQVKFAIYQYSDSSLAAETEAITIPAGEIDWYEALYSENPSLTTVEYALAAISDSSDILIYFDSGSTDQGVSQAETYADAWPDPATFNNDNNLYSIYNHDLGYTTIEINLSYQEAFLFEIMTTTSPQTFFFQADNAVGLEVDWGEGAGFVAVSDGSNLYSHSYADAGTYTVGITGRASRIAFGAADCTPGLLTDVLTRPSDGITHITSTADMFKGATAISQLSVLAELSSNRLFAADYGWNISNMSGMFDGATSFDQDISDWDTGSVTDMSSLFEGASAFDQDISGWDAGNVTNMTRMFYEAPYFNQPIGTWDTGSVTDMSQMFFEALDFDQDISGWDVSGVADFTDFLAGGGLSTLNYDKLLVEWSRQNLQSNVSFHAGSSKYSLGLPAERRNFLTDPDGLNWTITDGGATTTEFDSFYSTWDTTATSDGSSASDQVSLPLESDGTYDFTVYWGDGSSEEITAWDQAEVTHTYAEAGTYKILISGTISGWRFNNGGDKLKLSEIHNWGDLKLGNNGGYFYGCSNLDLSNVADVLDLSGTTTMSSAFRGSGITTVAHMNEWDTPSVTSMGYMFYDASNFNQPIGDWDVSSVTSMLWMFYDTPFNQDISGWDVSSVTDMRQMFYNAPFNQDISSWNVSNVENFESFLEGVELSTENYDKLLIDWSKLNLQTGLSFHGGDSEYSLGEPRQSRQSIIDNYSWTITDGGVRNFTWQGVDADWNNIANWDQGVVPGSGDAVVIPAGCSFYPTLPGDTILTRVTIEAGGELSLDGYNLTLLYLTCQGTLTADSSETITVSKDLDLSGGTFNYATSTLVLTGTDTTVVTGDGSFYNLTCSEAGKTINFAAGSTQTVEGTLNLAGADANLINLRSTTAGTQYNLILSDGGLQDISYLDLKDCDASAGIELYAAASTDSGNNLNIFFSEDGAQELIWQGDMDTDWTKPGNWDKGRVPAETDAVVIPGGLTNYPSLPADTTLASLGIDTGGSLNLGGYNLTVDYLTCQGTLTADSSETITVSRDLDFSGGTFSQASSTVILTGSDAATVKGDNTFYNLESTAAGKTINFTAGSTQTVEGTLNLAGADANLINLRSTTAGTPWNIITQAGSASINYVDVKDSDASGGDYIAAYDSTDSGNNSYWYFGQAEEALWTNGSGDGLWSTPANWAAGIVPGTDDNIIFDDSSTDDCTVDSAVTVASWIQEEGYTGTISLAGDLTVSETITINDGRLVDNGYQLSFVSAYITNEAGRLSSTGSWYQTGTGEVSNPNPDNAFGSYQLAGNSSGTLTNAVYTRKLILEAGSEVTGSGLHLTEVTENDFIGQGTDAVISADIFINTGNSLSQKAFSSSGNLTYQEASDATITLAGDWDIGGNLSVYGDSGGGRATLDTNGYNLSAGGALTLGQSSGDYLGGYPGRVKFRSGTHSVGGDLSVAGPYTHGTFDFGSSTLTVGGSLDFGYATVIKGTSTVNLTGDSTITATKDYAHNGTGDLINEAPFYNLNCQTAGQTITVAEGGLTVENELTPGSSEFIFTAADAGNSIDLPAYDPASSAVNKFYDLTFAGAGGAWETVRDLRIENNFSLVQGTFSDNDRSIFIGNNLAAGGDLSRGLELGPFTWTVGKNWDTSGENITVTPTSSTVDLTGTGSIKTGEGAVTFNNLNCATSGQTTTIDASGGNIEPYILGNLTLGGGTLNKTGDYSGIFTLRAAGAPFTLAGSSLDGVIIRYKPESAGTVDISGGDYGTAILDIYSTNDATTYNLASDISDAAEINVYAESIVTGTIFNLSGYNLTIPSLILGKTGKIGSVTVNSGSGQVEFNDTAGLSVAADGGDHAVNLDSSTWKVIGDWQLTNGSGLITVDSGTSVVLFENKNYASDIYGDNTFSTLKCMTPGKFLYFEDDKTQTVTDTLIFTGDDTKMMLLRSQSGGSWYLDISQDSDASATVSYTDVANSYASGKTVVASGSKGSGGNTNWEFTELGTIYWTGTAEDNNWSNRENWSTVTVPAVGDDIVFDGTSTKNCLIDEAAEVKSLSVNSGYTGTITLAANFNLAENFNFYQGTFDADSYDLSVGANFVSSGSSARNLNLGSGSWEVGGNWESSGTNLTLDFGTASFTMAGEAKTTQLADYDFASFIVTGSDHSLICSGSFRPTNFISSSPVSIEFTSADSGETFNTFGRTYQDVTFSGSGSWQLEDNLTVTGQVQIEDGKLVDNGKTVTFANLSIVNQTEALESTGSWIQSASGTISSPNSSNVFNLLSLTPSGETTTFTSDIYAKAIKFGIGTLEGNAKTVYLSGETNVLTSNNEFTVATSLASIQTQNLSSQKVFHLPDNLVSEFIHWYNNSALDEQDDGSIIATGDWDFGNNPVYFYGDSGASGKIDLIEQNLTAGDISLGYNGADYTGKLDLGSGNHSISSIAKTYSGEPEAGALALDLGTATIDNYSGSLDLTYFDFNCGGSTLNFSGGSGDKTITTADHPVYSLGFADLDSTWTLTDNLEVRGSLTLGEGTFSHNNQKVTLTGQDITEIQGEFIFYDLECKAGGKSIKFEAGSTQTVENSFVLIGDSGNRLQVDRIGDTGQWNIDAASAIVELAEVTNSNALTAIEATRSEDLGNNTGWTFSPVVAWDGGGDTNKWSEAANWEDDTKPTSEDGVVFDITSTKDCLVDEVVVVKELVLDTGYTGTVTVDTGKSITSTTTMTLNEGTLNDGGQTVNFKDLEVADSENRIISTGTWQQTETGFISSPNSTNLFNLISVTASGKTTTFASDIYAKFIEFGPGSLEGSSKTVYLSGESDVLTSPSEFSVASRLNSIQTQNLSSQGEFHLPDNLTIEAIEWYSPSGDVTAGGDWDFADNNVYFYADSGQRGIISTLEYNLTVAKLKLGKDDQADNNCYLNLGSGTHSIESISKAYPTEATGSLNLYLYNSTVNLEKDLDLTNINLDKGNSVINFTGALAQNITTAGAEFNQVNFFGDGPFNISGDFIAVNSEITGTQDLNCSGTFQVSSEFIPAFSTITLTSGSAGKQLDIPKYSSDKPDKNKFYELVFDGSGDWTLAKDLRVDEKITITGGNFIDNAKAIKFKNLWVADNPGLLESTGTWTQFASGEVAAPNKDSRVAILNICGTDIVTTFSEDVSADQVVFGEGTLEGKANNLYLYGTVDSIVCPAPFGVANSLTTIYTYNHNYQKAFHLPDNLASRRVHWRADSTLTATGNWNFGNNTVAFYTTPSALAASNLGTYSLTCGGFELGSPTESSYPAYLKLGSATHSIGSVSKAYVGSTSSLLNLELESSTINASGSINLDGITLVPGASAVILGGSSGAKSINASGQAFYNLAFNDADASWSLGSNLTVRGNLTLTAGEFAHNNKKVIISGAGTSKISGSFSFYDLECTSQGKEIQFEAGKTQTVSNMFKVIGGEGTALINLFSQTGGESWFLNPDEVEISYANIKDSTSQKSIVAVDSINSGGNSGWIIGGEFDISQPASGDILKVGEVTDIKWETVSSIEEVNLYYTNDADAVTPTWNRVDPNTLSNTPDGITTYSWIVPDDISSNCKVKVLAVVAGEETTNLFDISDTFKIMGEIEVTYPNQEGVGWPLDVQRNISWDTVGTVSNIKVYISRDGKTTWDYIGETSTNDYYSWRPSDDYSDLADNCYVKVTDSRYEDLVYDISDYNFRISEGSISNVRVTSGGVAKTNLATGYSYKIPWITEGSAESVDIFYSLDGGQNWSLLAGTVANDGSYDGTDDNGPWLVGHNLSDIVLVKVADSSKPTVFSETEELAIKSPFTVTSPAEGEVILGGSTHEITWQENLSGLSIDEVTIEYSIDGGETWNQINGGSYRKANDYSETWQIPEVSTGQARIRVSKSPDVSGFAYSDSANFKIKKGSVTLTQPNTAVSWGVGEGHEIRWDTIGDVEKVNIYYCLDGDQDNPSWVKINPAPYSASYKKYAWIIPDEFSSSCLIKIEDSDDPQINDLSDSLFAITPSFRVRQPNGGQEWIVGQDYEIKWETTGIAGAVKIDYSYDGGETWNLIEENLEGVDRYTWKIPETPSTDCFIRVSSLQDSSVSDQSDTAFKIILPTIIISSPEAGDIWAKGDQKEIVWTNVGKIYDNLTLEYSTDDFTTATLIGSGELNDGSFDWTISESVPDSSSIKIRIKDMTWASESKGSHDVSAVSEAFEITSPRIEVVDPNGGERLEVGESYTLKWSSFGLSSIGENVNIEYSPSGDFEADSYLIVESSPNDGEYIWESIPDSVSEAAKIRVYDASNLSIYDDSDAGFEIAPKVTITSPDPQSTLYVSIPTDITWDTQGSLAEVKLSYSISGGGADADWYNMEGLKEGDSGYAPTVVNNTGSYEWTVPNVVYSNNSPNPDVYFKLEAVDDSLIADSRRFTVSYYPIVWKVVDEDGLVGNLSGLDLKTIDVKTDTVFEQRSGLVSPAELYYYPGKTYNSTWSRDAYLDTAKEGWKADENGKEIRIKMPAKLIEKVRSIPTEISYDMFKDRLSLTAHLQEEEKMIPKQNLDKEIFGVTEVYVQIYDSEENIVTTSDSAAKKSLASTGIYSAKWDNLYKDGKLESGERYFARVRIMYQGAYHWGGTSFEITEAGNIKTIYERLGVTGSQTIAEKIKESSESTAQKVEQTREELSKQTEEAVTTIGREVSDTAAQTAEYIKIENTSRILNSDSYIKQNKELTVRYQAPAAASPVITIYDSDNEAVETGSMAESKSGIYATEGGTQYSIYTYKVKFVWGKGEYTIVCSEPESGTLDGMKIEVIATNLEDISTKATITMGQVAGIDTEKLGSLASVVGEVSNIMSDMVGNVGELSQLGGVVDKLSKQISENIYSQLDSVVEKIKEINEGQGIKIEKMYDLSKGQSGDINYVKNKTQEVKALAEVTEKVVTRTSDQPITTTWMELD
jgi:surface protein